MQEWGSACSQPCLCRSLQEALGKGDRQLCITCFWWSLPLHMFGYLCLPQVRVSNWSCCYKLGMAAMSSSLITSGSFFLDPCSHALSLLGAMLALCSSTCHRALTPAHFGAWMSWLSFKVLASCTYGYWPSCFSLLGLLSTSQKCLCPMPLPLIYDYWK